MLSTSQTEVAPKRSRHAVDATESYIGANPWQTVAITTAVGLLAGFLLGRRS